MEMEMEMETLSGWFLLPSSLVSGVSFSLHCSDTLANKSRITVNFDFNFSITTYHHPAVPPSAPPQAFSHLHPRTPA